MSNVVVTRFACIFYCDCIISVCCIYFLLPCKMERYRDSVDNTVEEHLQHLLPNPDALELLSARACSETLHLQNPPVLNCRFRLTHIDLYHRCKTVVGRCCTM